MHKTQVKSRKRVSDHGEVFTADREIIAMLDMVKHETERIDSRFLEPACGDGNFLEEILRRKLLVVKRIYGKSKSDYEKYSVLAISSVYGVDLLIDNVAVCRDRLLNIWENEYESICKNKANEECRESVQFILSRNIVCGNALTLLHVDENGQDRIDDPILFSEWAFIDANQTQLQRSDFRYDVLLRENDDDGNYSKQLSIFADSVDFSGNWLIDPVTEKSAPKPVGRYVSDYRRTKYAK